MNDLRQACRSLRSTPIASTVAVLSVALGIGAISTIFSLLNAMLMRPLAVRDAHQLVRVTADDGRRSAWPQAVWSEIRDRRILDAPFAWFWNRVDTSDGGERQLVDGMAASGTMFQSLGVTPVIGRLLTPEDDEPREGEPVVVISHRFWQQRYGRATDVLGQSIRIEGRPHRIVGVMPREFVGLYIGLPLDVVIPLGRSGDSTSAPYVHIMGRLPSGQTAEGTTSALRASQPQIRDATNPYTAGSERDAYLRAPFVARSAASGVPFLQRRYEQPFEILLIAVGLVLVIACGNVAMLQLARTTGRSREMNVRLALGASAARLAREVAVESVLIAGTGGVLATIAASWCATLVAHQLSTESYAVFLDLTLDWRVLAFVTAVSLTTALLSGMASVIYAMRADPVSVLKRQSGGSPRTIWMGHGTVVLHIAVSFVLVIGTLMFLRTAFALATVDVGFDRDRVLVVTIDAAKGSVAPADRDALYARVREAVRVLPGVEHVAMSVAMPGGNTSVTPWVELFDGTALPQGVEGVYANRVSDLWFRTLGTQVIAGREFEARDLAAGARVAVVNEAFVRDYLRGEQAIGRVILHRSEPDAPRQRLEIVGVVENAMYRFLREAPPPTVYTAMDRSDDSLPATIYLSVRGPGQPAPDLSRRVAGAIGLVNRDVSLSFRTLADQVDAQYAQERLVAGVASFFGSLAVIMTALGLYGVTAHAVTARRSELGIRLALGAAPTSIARLVLARVWILAATGIAIGLIASLWIASGTRSLLTDVAPLDVMAVSVGGLVLVAVATLAGLLPARRAARLDPLSSLRAD